MSAFFDNPTPVLQCTTDGKVPSIGCWQHAPFIAIDQEHSEVEGVFWSFARAGLQACCLSTRQITAAQENCSEWYTNENDALNVGLGRHHVILPVTQSPLFDALKPETDFLPFVSSPGGVVLSSQAHANSGVPQLGIIVQAWPLLVIIVLSTGFAGIFIWLLDRLKNPQEFPRPFIRGFWEGCWWAFVSMTTVGYGDRIPKSIVGRLFAFIWIIFGLCVISMFTATITTALSQGNYAKHDKGYLNYNIAVMGGTTERILANEISSTTTPVADIAQLLIVSGAVEGTQDFIGNISKGGPVHAIFMEHYMYAHLQNSHGGLIRKLQQETLVKKSSVRGIILTNFTENAKSCLRRYVAARIFIVYEELISMEHGHKEIRRAENAEDVAKQLFSNDGFKLAIFTGILLLLLLILFLWEFCYWRPRNPDYYYFERNWKFERKQKEMEFKRKLNFRRYYKHRRSTTSTSVNKGTSPHDIEGVSSPQEIECMSSPQDVEEDQPFDDRSYPLRLKINGTFGQA